jgi:anti-sigma B factor antagonist
VHLEHGSWRERESGDASALFAAELVQTEDGATVVVDGEIDLATSGCLWSVMSTAMALGPRLVLDLAGTTFIGATGLRLIVRAHHQQGRLRESLVIRSPRPETRRVLSITGVDQLVTIEAPPGAAPDDEERAAIRIAIVFPPPERLVTEPGQLRG